MGSQFISFSGQGLDARLPLLNLLEGLDLGKEGFLFGLQPLQEALIGGKGRRCCRLVVQMLKERLVVEEDEPKGILGIQLYP